MAIVKSFLQRHTLHSMSLKGKDEMNNQTDIKAHWEKENVESMYDKHLMQIEIDLVNGHLEKNTKILDAGCGEGEGTLEYSKIEGITIHAADYSDTRLAKAANRLEGIENVEFKKCDFLGQCDLDDDYDAIVSQRFLINLDGWDLQRYVLCKFMSMLKPGGKLILLEGSQQGAELLNVFRKIYGLEPIPTKWHNHFFDDHRLIEFITNNDFQFWCHDGASMYYLLTRGIRPTFDTKLDWDCEFNRIAASQEMRALQDSVKFSRVKLYVFKKGI